MRADCLLWIQGRPVISVDDTLKVIACKEQQKKLGALQMELGTARQEGFISKNIPENSGTNTKKRLMAVIGVMTRFGHKNNRDAVRKSWMHTGAALKMLEGEKGMIIRFVIGRSAKLGDSLDRDIDSENRQANDFIILNDQVEAPELLPKKTKLLVHAVEHWDAEFYVKVNDDIYVNIDALGVVLVSNLDKTRAYIGCTKSGEVFSELNHKWYEPDWWKFGDGKSYFDMLLVRSMQYHKLWLNECFVHMPMMMSVQDHGLSDLM
ncbi:hypothetical protein RJ639_047392 [Escallonia herrerae]|uniref:Hexosyltransferase n=1 Tax=Escallonia herrerae TaxID=1293975 RepID=A0AA88W8P1_9ASTE|nr:hypothetical protein RJ639_047392 [Escallonia herrerae]